MSEREKKNWKHGMLLIGSNKGSHNKRLNIYRVDSKREKNESQQLGEKEWRLT